MHTLPGQCKFCFLFWSNTSFFGAIQIAKIAQIPKTAQNEQIEQIEQIKQIEQIEQCLLFIKHCLLLSCKLIFLVISIFPQDSHEAFKQGKCQENRLILVEILAYMLHRFLYYHPPYSTPTNVLAIAVAFWHAKILKIYVRLPGKIIILKGSDLTNLTKLNNVLSGIKMTSLTNTSSFHAHFVTSKLQQRHFAMPTQ